MATLDMHKSPRCQHIHFSGRPCKAPARRGRNFCVFHQAAHLDPGGCSVPIVEDLHSYQLAVIRIMQSLAADAIDSKKATALLYALQLLGGKLDKFVEQREEFENPALALRKELTARYDARKRPFPSYIPEKDVLAILKEMRAEELAETNDAIEVIPQSPPRVIPSDEVAPRSAAASEDLMFQARSNNLTPSPRPASRDPRPGTVDKLEACDDLPDRQSPIDNQKWFSYTGKHFLTSRFYEHYR